jgi:hypothetical protein
MRGSQIFAAVVIIALVAMGLIYLEAHGFFHDQRTAAMGQLTPDANAPKAEPPEADQASLSAPNSPGGMTGNLAASPSPAPVATDSAATYSSPNPPADPTGRQPVTTAINQPVTPTKVFYPSDASSPQATANQNTSPSMAATNVNSKLAVTKPTAASLAQTTVAPAPGERTRTIYKIVYVDAQGNACQAKRVPVRTVTVSATPRVHRVRRRVEIETDTSWIYSTQPAPPRPVYVASTACGMLHQLANGQRVVNLPPGMALNVALDRQLSTLDTPAGQEFQGYLVGPITYCGEVIVPAGATVQGTVVRSHHRGSSEEDEAVLQLRLSAIDANGFNVPVSAFSSNRREADEVPYTTVGYMNDPNYLETARDSTRDVTLPAQSVVTFSLRSGAVVSF